MTNTAQWYNYSIWGRQANRVTAERTAKGGGHVWPSDIVRCDTHKENTEALTPNSHDYMLHIMSPGPADNYDDWAATLGRSCVHGRHCTHERPCMVWYSHHLTFTPASKLPMRVITEPCQAAQPISTNRVSANQLSTTTWQASEVSNLLLLVTHGRTQEH